MATIVYDISNGIPPFTVTLYKGGAVVDINNHATMGQYHFSGVTDGHYTIRVDDATVCYAVFSADVLCTTTSTSTSSTSTSTSTQEPTTSTTTIEPTTSTSTTKEQGTTSTSTTEEGTTTSTTTEEEGTTTTTTIERVQCGENLSLSFGGSGYPVEREFVLGNDTGYVIFEYNAGSVPDRFILYFDNDLVVDTGYCGNQSLYGLGGENRTLFNNSLSGLIDPVSGHIYPITGSDLTDYNNNGYNINQPIETDGYPYIFVTSGEECFNKITTTSTCLLNIYSPLNTALYCRIECPIEGECSTTTTTTTTTVA